MGARASASSTSKTLQASLEASQADSSDSEEESVSDSDLDADSGSELPVWTRLEAPETGTCQCPLCLDRRPLPGVVYLRSPHRKGRCSVRPMPLVQRAQRSRVSVFKLVVSASNYGRYPRTSSRAHTYKKCSSTHGRLPDACPDRPIGDASRRSLLSGHQKMRAGGRFVSSHALSELSQSTARGVCVLPTQLTSAAQTDGMTLGSGRPACPTHILSPIGAPLKLAVSSHSVSGHD